MSLTTSSVGINLCISITYCLLCQGGHSDSKFDIHLSVGGHSDSKFNVHLSVWVLKMLRKTTYSDADQHRMRRRIILHLSVGGHSDSKFNVHLSVWVLKMLRKTTYSDADQHRMRRRIILSNARKQRFQQVEKHQNSSNSFIGPISTAQISREFAVSISGRS